MLICFATRAISICSVAILFVGQLGCRSGSAEASERSSTADISGPPTFNELFQARNPRVCRQVMTPPTPEEAKALVQCNWEGKSIMSGSSADLGLVTDVQVQMSKPRPFRMGFVNAPDVDTTAMVYDLRGQATSWNCLPVGAIYAAGQNCARYEADPRSVGQCYRTTFGDWKCQMTVGGPQYSNRLKGPTTF